MASYLLVTGTLAFCALGLLQNTRAATTDAETAPKGVCFPSSCDQKAAGDFRLFVPPAIQAGLWQARQALPLNRYTSASRDFMHFPGTFPRQMRADEVQERIATFATQQFAAEKQPDKRKVNKT